MFFVEKSFWRRTSFSSFRSRRQIAFCHSLIQLFITYGMNLRVYETQWSAAITWEEILLYSCTVVILWEQLSNFSKFCRCLFCLTIKPISASLLGAFVELFYSSFPIPTYSPKGVVNNEVNPTLQTIMYLGGIGIKKPATRPTASQP